MKLAVKVNRMYILCFIAGQGDRMRKIQSILAIVTVFILLMTLTGNVHAAPPTVRAKWTVMVYMSGDNDLEGYVVPDIEEELAATGSTADVQVVALVDRGPGYDTSYGDWQTTEYFHVMPSPGMKADLAHADADWDAAHADELNMGNPQSLIDFVTWTRAHYPADHYALYFWGHGWNWRPGYVMRDDSSNEDSLDMKELEVALPSIGFIDMVAYDGCNMAAIEVQTLWHGHATALAHSEEYVYWEGVQYDQVLERLTANPNMIADQLAITTSETSTEDKTWSAVAVDSRFGDLLTAVDEWSDALLAGLPQNRRQYSQAFQAAQSFWHAQNDKDLYDMAEEIDRVTTDSTLKRASRAVMQAVDEVVLHERHVSGPGYAGVHGISIYYISKASQKDTDYSYYRNKLEFAAQTGWDDFLDMYAR